MTTRLLRTAHGKKVHPAEPGADFGLCGDWGSGPMIETNASFGPVCQHCEAVQRGERIAG